MKTLEFIYQEKEVHFLFNPNDKNVMINATEMANAFGKRTKDYLANSSTKTLIEAIERTLISVRSENELTGKSVNSEFKILDNRGHMGIYFCEDLALDFAMWLDVNFKLWVYKTIRDLLTKETKIVKTAVDYLSEKELALKKIVTEIQENGSSESKLLLNALSDFENAKKSKTKAFSMFSKQMSMDL